jgi:hypothetical protein
MQIQHMHDIPCPLPTCPRLIALLSWILRYLFLNNILIICTPGLCSMLHSRPAVEPGKTCLAAHTTLYRMAAHYC